MHTGRPIYISTNTTTQVATGKAKLFRIVLGETAAGAITIYDALSATGTPKFVFKASIVEGTYEIGAEFKTGICVVTAGASKLTCIVG